MDKPSEQRIYEFDDFHLDAGHLILSCKGEEITLAPKAVETLLALIEHHGEVVSKDELLEAVWPDTIVEESNLFSYLSHLRKALGSGKNGKPYIETLRRRGYRFNGNAHLLQTVSDGDSSYAWVVDNPDENGASVKTRSGRLYVLKDWNRDKTTSRQAQAVPQPQTAELTDAPTDVKEPLTLTPNDEPFPKLSRRPVLLATLLGILVIATLGFYLWRVNTQPTTPIKTIAVLPFKPLVAENRDEWLEMGIADALIRKLGGGDQLTVRPLAAVRRFASLEQNPLEAGRDLGVEAVLSGSVQIADNRIRISVELLRVLDGKQLWADQFDQPSVDIFQLQNSISERVAASLQIPLGTRIIRDYTQSVEAYQLYLNGRLHTFRLVKPEAMKAISFYESAIERDPSYTLAYVGLTNAYRSLVLTSDQNPIEVMPKAKTAALRAVELDPDLAEAQIALANLYFWYEWDWASAEKHFLRALALDSKNLTTHLYYAHFLSNTGRHEQAIEEVRIGRALEPVNLLAMAYEGQILMLSGRHDEAQEVLRRAVDMDPTFWLAHLFLSKLYIEMGKYEEAIKASEMAEKISEGNAEAAALTAWALAKSGNRNGALRILAELEARAKSRYVPAYSIAIVHNSLGDKDNALKMLETSIEQKDALMTFLKVEPKWNNVRSEPRFIELMKKMNLE